MASPLQCLQSCVRTVDNRRESYLFGASGSRLVAIRLSTGNGSTWPPVEEISTGAGAELDEERPGKRVKLSPASDSNGSGPNFTCLAVSNDTQYLVAITGEDKSIRVFHVDSDAQIRQLSQRCMARRPCAVALTVDDSVILCADKFGDVYSLPLHPPPDDTLQDAPVEVQNDDPQKDFKPAASLLTVHSGRNRKVLEEQIKSASKGQRKSKEPLKFKHELLLGHVSMLTDIIYTTVEGRGYIITSDRDEHIRISRGPPQAHIIEGFCHGHREFVNRLCLVSPGLLVSGGGDTHLFVWDWLNYQLLTTIDVRAAALRFLKSQPDLASTLPEQEESFKIAVTGIWNIPSNRSDKEELLVTCEGLPALFHFHLSDPTKSEQIIPLEGNAIDVTVYQPSENTYIAAVSVDPVYKPGLLREPREQITNRSLQAFSRQHGGQWNAEAGIDSAILRFNEQLSRNPLFTLEEGSQVDLKAVQDLLYGVGNLRKQPGSDLD